MSKTFLVYHKKNPDFSGAITHWPYGYAQVARVEATELGEVFQLTNHIDTDWTENKEVTLTYPGGKRSTSVGDVIIELDETDNGADKLWAVMGMGFKPLYEVMVK